MEGFQNLLRHQKTSVSCYRFPIGYQELIVIGEKQMSRTKTKLLLPIGFLLLQPSLPLTAFASSVGIGQDVSQTMLSPQRSGEAGNTDMAYNIFAANRTERTEPNIIPDLATARENLEAISIRLDDPDLTANLSQMIEENSLNQDPATYRTKAYLAVWPSSGSSNDGEAAINTVTTELSKVLPQASVEAFNMAENLNWYHRLLDTDKAVVKETVHGKPREYYNNAEAQKFSVIGRTFKEHGEPGKAVIVIQTSNRFTMH